MDDLLHLLDPKWFHGHSGPAQTSRGDGTPAGPKAGFASPSATESIPVSEPQPTEGKGAQPRGNTDLAAALQRVEVAVGVSMRLEENMSSGNALMYASRCSNR